MHFIAVRDWRIKKSISRFSNDHFFGLADQAVVSAANFLVLFIVARWTSVADVGWYALAISASIVLIDVQDSLITRPYTIQIYNPPVSKGAHAFGALSLAVMFAASAAALFATATLILSLAEISDRAVSFLAILSVVVPLVLLRQFARRFTLANLRVPELLILDMCYFTLLFGGLMILIYIENFSVITAIGAIGIANATVFAAWLLLNRSNFDYHASAIGKTAQKCWNLGRWLLPGKVARVVEGYQIHWMSLLLAGAAATGTYAACLSIIALSNPFLVGMFNIMAPKAAKSYNNGGSRSLKTQIIFDTLIIAVVMGGFAAVIMLFGGNILTLIFPAEDYSGNSHLLSILVLSAFAIAVGGPATIALTSMSYGKTDSSVAIWSCLLSAVLITSSMMIWGLIGAVYGGLISSTLSCLARWYLLHQMTKSNDKSNGHPAQHTSRSASCAQTGVENG